MNRKVLLLEPNYRNKYPPMGLMKIATYYRNRGDDVRFFKGDLKIFACELLYENFINEVEIFGGGVDTNSDFVNFLRTGKKIFLDELIKIFGDDSEKIFREYRSKYKRGEFRFFDVIAVTTLFTFYWQQTIDTINEAKKFLKPDGKIFIGGVAATLVPEYIKEETGLETHLGLLDKPGDLDENDSTIIDELPLDYSILDDIDYIYPAHDAYFAYTTRGCIRNCDFCAVKTLEPEFKNYVPLKKNIDYIDEHFGAKTDLLLLDNNVLASPEFEKIIDEIKSCGFERGAMYIPPDEYDIAVQNLDFNERTSIKKILRLYEAMIKRLQKIAPSTAESFEELLKYYQLTRIETATADAIKHFHPTVKSLRKKYFKRIPKQRHVDFNQGIDARLVNDSNMKKLSEICINPLRIAFDHIEQKEIYINAVRLAAKYGINYLSNYLLYNFLDKPADFYERLRINVELCDELSVQIFSFPMKYQPIRDPKYFRSRDFLGTHWNRKFIRAVQCILNSTGGKIGRGKHFFETAFGKNLGEFEKILWMPESFIINRMKYKDNLAMEWEEKFFSADEQTSKFLKEIIAENVFTDEILNQHEILKFYLPR